MTSYVRIGVDIAKNFFQVHALPEEGCAPVRRKLSRAKFLDFFQGLPPCRIAMEACGSAHHWGRTLSEMGHDVLLIPPIYTKPYVKRGKNDAADAEAICEAMSRPGMRYVPIKTKEQQALLGLHTHRDLLIKQQTMCANSLRSFLAEFGIISAKSIYQIPELIAAGRGDQTLPDLVQARLNVDAAILEALSKGIAALDREIARVHASNPVSQLLDGAPGIGVLTASAIVAHVPDPSCFQSGRDFSAWLGLTPREHSSGGKAKLGGITKRGNPYLRKLLVLAATSLLRIQARRTGALAEWVSLLLSRKPARLVTVALANRLARTLWAMMKTGEAFREEIFAKGVPA